MPRSTKKLKGNRYRVTKDLDKKTVSSQQLTRACTASYSKTIFAHDRLEDPGKQIRLLRFRHASGNDGDVQSVELSTWRVDDAPAYKAISYTWGDISEHTIWIGDRPLPVRRNCFYALWQVRRFLRLTRDESYIWIDSICINQADLAEKGHQVRIMWNIYQKAGKVLACVGPGADDSAELFRVANTARDFDDISRWPDGWLNYIGEINVTRLHRAFDAFSYRDYWTRLWIVQEVAAQYESTNAGVVILCGEDYALLQDVHSTLSLLNEANLHKDPKWHQDEITKRQEFSEVWKTPFKTVLYSSPGLDLQQIASTYRAFRCCDPRDRIFGLLHLGAFPPEVSKLLPDYTMSAWDLGLLLADHLDLPDVEKLLRSLEIDATHPEMQRLVARAERGRPLEEEAARPNQTELMFGEQEESTRQYTYLRTEQNNLQSLRDCLVGNQTFLDAMAEELARLGLSPRRRGKSTANIESSLPLVVKAGETVVALVNRDSRPRDILVEIPRAQHSYIIVLREIDGEGWGTEYGCARQCEIVGQGITVFNHSLSLISGCSTQLDLWLTAEDKMLLAGQDIMGRGEEIDPGLRLLRLTRSPFVTFGCGATLRDVYSMSPPGSEGDYPDDILERTPSVDAISDWNEDENRYPDPEDSTDSEDSDQSKSDLEK